MIRTAALLTGVALLTGCAPARDVAERAAPPRDRGGVNVLVYLEAVSGWPQEVDFAVDSVVARGADGGLVPLDVRVGGRIGAVTTRDRLLATGRLAPGTYEGLVLGVADPAVRDGDDTIPLRMDEAAVFVPTGFRLAERDAAVVHVRFQPERAVRDRLEFRPSFSAGVSQEAMLGVIAAVSVPEARAVVLVDKVNGRVQDLIPTGGPPFGVAIDVDRRRLYVAVGGSAAVEIYDLPGGSRLDRVPLSTGDDTIDVAVSPDGTTVLAANAGSGTVSVIDAFAAFERERVRVGDDPFEIVMHPNGDRAFVVSRRSASVSVLRVPSGALIASIATEARPTRLALDGRNELLYVAQERSSNLLVIDTTTLASTGRVFVGPGGSAVLLDANRARLYVARRGSPEMEAFEAGSQLPLERIPVDGTVTFLALDIENNRIVMVQPDTEEIRLIDAVRYRPAARVDLPGPPFEVAFFQRP